MFMLNQLAGFNAADAGLPFGVRRVGGYAVTFAASTAGTATIPGADLGPTDPDRQLLIFAMHEVQNPVSVVCNGVTCQRIVRSFAFSNIAPVVFDYPGNGDASITVNVGSSTSVAGWIEVFEVNKAVDCFKAHRHSAFTQAATASIATVRQQLGDIVIGVTQVDTEATTTAYTNLTELSDADIGSFASASGSNGPNVSSDRDHAVTTTISASGNSETMLLDIQPAARTGVKGGIREVGAPTVASGTATLSTVTYDLTGLGDGTLIVGIAVEGAATVTGVTWGGNAMTARGSIANTGAAPDMQLSFWSIPFTQASPSGTLVATMSGSGNDGLIAGISQWVVYDIGGFGTAAGQQGNAVGAAVNYTATAGGMALAIGIRAAAALTFTWTGATDIGSFSLGAYTFGLASKAHDTAGAQSITGTSTSGQYATLVLPLNP
jgi:hypothetical protein